MQNQRIVLDTRPQGAVSQDNFRLETLAVPGLEDGEVLVRNQYLSLDPYMRGRLDDRKSYADPQPLGEVMIGGTVGEVVESRADGFEAGDRVVGMGGWQHFAALKAAELRKVPTSLPASVFLGPAGMPGVTAWVGLNDIGAPKPNETVVVSSAAGAVGGVVGQLAKARGARAVGIAGGPDKCRYVTDTLGFDACVDYKAPDLAARFAEAVPDGVDVYFENVGGRLFELVLEHINPFARIPLCGWISSYDGQDIVPIRNLPRLLVMRAKLQGFIVAESPERWPPALQELTSMLAESRLHYAESVSQGLSSAPAAFIGMLHGTNFGKQLVKLE